MPSNYPAQIDTQIDVTTGVSYVTEPLLEDMHASAVAVQTVLGTNPAGASPTVRARLEGLDSAVAGKASAVHTHAAGDIATGLLDSARLPFTGTPTGAKFLRDDLSWQTPAGGGGSAFITPEVWVASADAPTAVKDAITAAGGYVCDGTADQVQINAAIDKAAPLQSRSAVSPAGAEGRGLVMLTGGRFTINGSVGLRTAVALAGCGWGTELFASGLGSAPMVNLRTVNEHAVELRDMHLYGNWASGGTGDGVDFDMTGSTSGGVGEYPSTSPDSYNRVYNLYINGFGNGTTRTGVRFYAGATANNRGNWAERIIMHDVSEHGFWVDGSSDNYLHSIHLGTCVGSGLRLEGGNNYVTNSSFTYCDGWGAYLGSGRHVLSAVKLQDNINGMYMGASTTSIAGLIIDTCQTDGLVIASDDFSISALMIMFRTSGRFGSTPQSIGLRFSGTRTGLTMMGTVVPSNITTTVSGTTPTNSFIRLGRGASGLYSVGT